MKVPAQPIFLALWCWTLCGLLLGCQETPGPAGAAGADRIDGRDGNDGAPGARGPAGADGSDGRDGTDGADGAQGAEGRDGQDGQDGAPGEQGPPEETSHCAPFDPSPGPALSLIAARAAHRWHELKRHLRYYEALQPGFLLRTTAQHLVQERIDDGEICFEELYQAGRLLFEHEYSHADGLGNGLGDGSRPTPFRRVQAGLFGAPETTTCTSCHWRGGRGGSGALQDNSFILGDGDSVRSADVRNPPALVGVGAIQSLAQEMSLELQAQRDELIARAEAEGSPQQLYLEAKGTGFGVLIAHPDGSLDTNGVEGVDPDLRIKPFGWKGNFVSLRDFISESLHAHIGIQSEDLLAHYAEQGHPDLLGDGEDPSDPDADGHSNELTSGQLTALISYVAALGLPGVRPHEALHEFGAAAENTTPVTATVFLEEWTRGRQRFHELGCSGCHRPYLVLEEPIFRTRSELTGESYEIDLSVQTEQPRLDFDPLVDGYPVWLFSDLKRHDLGADNDAEHLHNGVARSHYLTRPLWGLAQSPPYMYDGQAPWFDHAIQAHGGEASAARLAYEDLNRVEQGELKVYLMSLRRNPDLVIP